MKISSHNSFDINVLKGALITNPNGAEYYIKGVSVDVVNHSISIDLQARVEAGATYKILDAGSVEWSTLKDWEIQFQGAQ